MDITAVAIYIELYSILCRYKGIRIAASTNEVGFHEDLAFPSAAAMLACTAR